MKVQCDILLDLEAGSYEIAFHNLSEPGVAMDYARLRVVLRRVLADFDDRQLKPRSARRRR